MRFLDVKNKFLIILLIVVGTVTCSSTMVKSGLLYDFGVGFWGANGHDGVWHIAIIKSLSQPSLNMPILAGQHLQNYHLGFDAFTALLHVITRISISTLYFQVLPPVFALLIGIFVYKVVYNWQKSKTAAWWSVFFVYFGTSFSWILGKGDSSFWAQQSLSTLINPPFALSLILMLIGIWSIQTKRHILAILCFGLLTEVKVYAGLLSLAGLFIAAVKERRLLKVWLGSLILAVPLFLLTNSQSAGLIVWRPGWFLETLFAPDRLDIPKYFSALNTYRVGQIWSKAIPAFSVAFLIFIIGNSGTRLVALLSIKITNWFEQFGLTIILLGALIPMFIVQKGTPWNTIQFFYYSLFFLSLFAGASMAKIIKYVPRPSLKLLISIFFVVLSVPEIVGTLSNYLPSRPPAQISKAELSALAFLSAQPKGVVITTPFDVLAANAAIPNPPRPLYLYESTAYVSAYSGQTSYLADEVNLNITGFSISDRRNQLIEFFDRPTPDFLKTNSITYIYLTPHDQMPLTIPGLRLVYDQDGFKIYKFNPDFTINISDSQALAMISHLPAVSEKNSPITLSHFDDSKQSWLVNTNVRMYRIDAQTGVIYDATTNQPVTPLAPRQ